MESRRLSPLLTESTCLGVRNRRKEMKGAPHLSCSHVSLFQDSGSLSESTTGICWAGCIKNQTLKLEHKRITLKVYYVLISSIIEKEINILTENSSCFSENSTELYWILLLKFRSRKIIWQKHSQRYGKVETITVHNSGDTIHTAASVTGAGQCQLV